MPQRKAKRRGPRDPRKRAAVPPRPLERRVRAGRLRMGTRLTAPGQCFLEVTVACVLPALADKVRGAALLRRPS